jgi:hypothetical protein
MCRGAFSIISMRLWTFVPLSLRSFTHLACYTQPVYMCVCVCLLMSHFKYVLRQIYSQTQKNVEQSKPSKPYFLFTYIEVHSILLSI